MKIKSLVKIGLGVITATVLLSGCAGSEPLPLSNLQTTTEKVEISKNAIPYKQEGGVIFNDDLITDKLGNINVFGNIGNELYYAILDSINDKILFKNSKGKVIKEFPYLNTNTVEHNMMITQNNDKELYIYEVYGNIYKSITKFDGKNFKVIMKNKDIYSHEYKIGKYIFVVPTNSLGPTKTMYQNIEMSTQKDISKRLKRIDSSYDMVIFPLAVAGDNIIYTCDDSIFALNTVTNQVTTLANKNSMIQFLRNGYDYYLRILDNPKDVFMYSYKNEFDKKGKVIDLSTLNYVNLSPTTLNSMNVIKLHSKNRDILVYEAGYLEKYFRNETYSKVGFL